MSFLVKAMSQAAAGAGGVEKDEYFNQTTLLLHGDGNQGANNFSNAGPPSYLAFSDNSSNDFPITVNGDAYGSPFSPYSLSDGNWSNYFDGNSDYLTTPVSANLGLGSSDFSIEWWENRDSTKNYAGVLGGNTSYVALYDPIIWSESGNVVVYLSSAASSWDTLNAFNLGSIDVGQWVHFCLTKNGSTFRGFKNGVLTSVTTTTNTVYMSANSWRIGYAQNRGGVDTFPGNISNLRMSIGSIPTGYQTSSTTPSTSIFTPSTSPLTTSSQGATSTDVELLICQSNRFKDNSSNAFTITPNGNVAVKTLNPFNATLDGTTGSGYFDGSGDNLSVPDNAAFTLTGDFTIQCWLYQTGSFSLRIFLSKWDAGGQEFYLYTNTGGVVGLAWGAYNTAGYTSPLLQSASSAVSLNAWTHIAVTRSSNTFTLYVNGVSADTASFSTGASDGPEPLYVGIYDGASYGFQGYVSDLQIVNGTAETITVPTTTLPNVTNTELLTCQYQGTVRNVGFIDSSPNNFPITRNGNTTQGTFSPFSNAEGEWSNYFDGTSNGSLRADSSTDTDLSGDFTIQAWVYPTANGQSSNSEIISRGATTTLNGWHFGLFASTTQPFFGVNYAGTGATVFTQSSTNIPLNQWTHLAVTRSGNTVIIYINGVADTTNTGFTGTPTVSGTEYVYVGRASYDTSNRQFTGYVSNASIVKGTAATTFNTTSPLATGTSGQSLLTCYLNRFVDANTATTAKALTVGSGARVQPFSPFAPSAAYSTSVNGGSGYFDGTGDYLTSASGGNLGSGDFTVQFWINPSVQSNYAAVLGTRQGTSWYTGEWSVDLASNGMYFIFATYATGSTPITLPNFAWTHIAFVRSGSTFKTYRNGVLVATDSNSDNYTTTAIGIGNNRNGNASPFYTGYLAGLQLIPGTALYSTDFTPPTAPPTVVSGTSLLLNFTNAGIYDSTAKNDLETVGNAQVDTSVVKYGTGSMKFDGASDYLKAKNSRLFDLGSGDFTLEFWAYHNNITSPVYQMYCGQFNSGGTTPGWNIYKYTNGSVQFYGPSGTPTLTSSNVMTAGNWYHIAVTRSGSTIRLFIDGTQEASTTNASFTDETTNSFYVGARSDVIGTYDMNGYIDDLRITKGVARYTSSFTVPDKAFPNQ